MAIPDGYKINFKTLLRAARNENLALVECRHKKTGESAYIIAAVVNVGPDDKMDVVPLVLLFDSNPYEMPIPPSTSDKDNQNEN